jgi:hypothetical protein
VSALISQIRLCWRPLGQQERLDEPTGSDSGSAPPLPPSKYWEEERKAPHFSWHRKKGPSLRKSPELKRAQGDPVALSKWVRRQSHKTIPVAQKGVSFQGSHRAWLPAQLIYPLYFPPAMGPLDPGPVAEYCPAFGQLQ